MHQRVASTGSARCVCGAVGPSLACLDGMKQRLGLDHAEHVHDEHERHVTTSRPTPCEGPMQDIEKDS